MVVALVEPCVRLVAVTQQYLNNDSEMIMTLCEVVQWTHQSNTSSTSTMTMR